MTQHTYKGISSFIFIVIIITLKIITTIITKTSKPDHKPKPALQPSSPYFPKEAFLGTPFLSPFGTRVGL